MHGNKRKKCMIKKTNKVLFEVKNMAAQGNKKTKTVSSKSIPKPKSASKNKLSTAKGKSGKTTTRVSYAVSNQGETVWDEIILLLIITASVVTLIGLLSDKMGMFGAFLSAIMKGLLGFGGLLLPIFVILFCIWKFVKDDCKGFEVKIAASILFILCVAMMVHVWNFTNHTEKIKFTAKMTTLFQQGAFTNGGLLGGMLGDLFIKAFGRIGSIFILFVLILISIILGTGKSFFRMIYELFLRTEEEEDIYEEEDEYEQQQIRKPREAHFLPKPKKKYKKGDFDIRVHEINEEKEQERPIVETTLFRPKRSRTTVKSRQPIYDYVKESSQDIPQEDIAVDEVLDEIVPEFEPEIHPDFIEEEIQEDILIQPEEEISLQLEEETASMDEVYTDANWTEENELPQLLEEIPDQTNIPSPEEEQSPSQVAKPLDNLKQTGQPSIEAQKKEKPYSFPPMELLGKDVKRQNSGSKVEMMKNAKKLEETLKSFGVVATVIQINRGPTVTRYELSPSQGVKVSKIVNLADDIALNLAASGIRIEAPIPGKAAVGIEVPNKETQSVFLRNVLESEEFQKFPSKLAFALGEDIAGNAVVTDIAKMPHLLIAGATGSGKSVCINTLITSILYKADPKEVKLLLVDPKVVELSVYNGIPHLLIPVVTDPKKASAALNWAVREMLARYQDFAEHNVRDIKGFNAMKREKGEVEGVMPQIVIIIDELADLMMAAPGEVEDSICRLAQMARAAGMHLIIATQRPSVDVITGVIKANIPSRLAFAVSSGIDSRTILDMVGAEKLLGKGDMLFYPAGMSKPIRVQGAFVTDKEVESIVDFVKESKEHSYDEEMIQKITAVTHNNTEAGEESDEFFDEAIELVVEKEKASVSMLQRQFRIGYNRAARLVDDLERRGIVGPEEGSKPRKVLLTKAQLAAMKNPEPSQQAGNAQSSI